MLRTPFSNEQVILKWSSLTLTTHRVVSSAVGRSETKFSSALLLRFISGTSVERSDSPGLLGAAAVIFVTSLIAAQYWRYEILLLALAFTALLVYLYVGSRALTLTVFGDGRCVRCRVKGGAAGGAREMADRVEQVASYSQRTGRLYDEHAPAPP